MLLGTLIFGWCSLVLGDPSNMTGAGRMTTAPFPLTNPQGFYESKTFEEAEKKLRDLLNSVFKFALPYIMRSSSDMPVSGSCTSSLLRVILGARQMKSWAAQMLDSMGKPPSGMLEGTALSLGNYDECLKIVVSKGETIPSKPEEELFRGQYCMMEVKVPKAIIDVVIEYQSGNQTDSPLLKTKSFLRLLTGFRSGMDKYGLHMGVCLPSKCTFTDVRGIATRATTLLGYEVEVKHCNIAGNKEISTEQIVILSFLGMLLAFVGGALVLDIWLWILRIKTGFKPPKSTQEPLAMGFLRSFSLKNNIEKLLTVETTQDPVGSLRGIRVFTVIAAMNAMTYLNVHRLNFLRYGSPTNFFRLILDFSFANLANSSVGIDSFIFIAGVMVTYPRWKRKTETGAKLGICDLLFGNFIRITAAQSVAIVTLFLLPVIGSGPLWDEFVEPQVNNCRERWWANLLYISNYFDSEFTCLNTTWFLSVVMQLYIVTLFVLPLLKWKPRIGVTVCIGLILVGILSVTGVLIYYHMPGPMSAYIINMRTGPKVWYKIFLQIYDHIGPYCIGLLTGYAVAQCDQGFKMKMRTATAGWCAAIFFYMTVIYGLFAYRDGTEISISVGILYSIYYRNAWALTLAWLVFTGATGYGGLVNSILSWKALQPLDKLCYFSYLFQLHVIYYHSGVMRERMHMGVFEQMIKFIAYTVISFVMAAMAYVSLQMPYQFLENLVASRFKEKTPQIETVLKGKFPVVLAAMAKEQEIKKTGEAKQKDSEKSPGRQITTVSAIDEERISQPKATQNGTDSDLELGRRSSEL